MADSANQRLKRALAETRSRISQIRGRNEGIGEQNTKAILIEPVLSALGWDLSNWQEVCREYRSKPQDNPVDYALLINGTPKLFVEAKDLNADLTDRKWTSQIVSYAAVVGVRWCVLTNGDEYRLYNAHAPVDVEEKLFRVVRVSDVAHSDYVYQTLDLLSKGRMSEDLIDRYWQEYFADRTVEAALYDLLRNDDTNFIRLIRKKSPELTPSEIRESLERASIHVTFASTRITRTVAAPAKKAKTTRKSSHKATRISLVDIIQAGLIVPPIQLEGKYKEAELKAVLQSDGKILFDGVSYDSPTASANAACKAIAGERPGRPELSVDGWHFWEYRDPKTGVVTELDDLRKTYADNDAKPE